VADGDPEVAAAALTAVAAGSHPHGDRLLEQAIATGDAFLRRAAVRALGSRPTSTAVELLIRAAALADAADLSQDVIDALTRLASAGDEAPRAAAVAALMDLAMVPEARDAALRAMAALPERTVDDLAAALHAPRPKIKLTAVEALARMRHPRASEALRVALHD
jgi:HEAT repeat protein